MIKLFFVGDGPRDEAVVPHLVAKILALDALQSGFSPWASLHKKSKGYARKLRFAIRQARDQNALGLVATVDSDESGRSGRLNQLRDGRDEDRQSAPPFPTSLGEAIPHLEAWLLDDEARRFKRDCALSFVSSWKSITTTVWPRHPSVPRHH